MKGEVQRFRRRGEEGKVVKEGGCGKRWSKRGEVNEAKEEGGEGRLSVMKMSAVCC